MATWTARMRITKDCAVSAEAESEEEARAKFRTADFSIDSYDEMVDWDDPREMEEEK